MNKSLDEIKEELAQAFALQSNYTATYDRNRLCEGYVAGFSACQSLSIDKREVHKLVDALDECRWIKESTPDETFHRVHTKAKEALEAFYSRHEDMRGK